MVGILADGGAGMGWQLVGTENFLGVAGQGVTGLLVARGFQPDFPGQLQAQMIGILAITLWGFLSGLILCVPLGLLFHGLQRSERRAVPDSTAAESELPPPEQSRPFQSAR